MFDRNSLVNAEPVEIARAKGPRTRAAPPGPFLVTKLFVPRLRPDRVTRPRLIARLSQGLGGKLILVSAPAGFGKTTLVSEWLRQSKLPFTWFSLDDGDNDPARFLACLVAALQQIGADWGQSVLGALCSPDRPAPAELVTLLINEIAADGSRFILALDDVHLITARPVHDALAFLLDNMPPHMHVVIMTRADPPFPLSRWRARRELTEVRADDLRFTGNETSTLLNEVVGLDLTPTQIAVLEARTEGWVAGLQMAALSLKSRSRLQRDKASFIEAFAGSHRYVMDYLIEEVFIGQPPHVQEFLLQTSILDRLSGPLCDALTGRADGWEMLEQLDRANLFTVPLDDHRHWYRYHRLFADLLRDRLRQDVGHACSVTLHCRASAWYEGQGLAAEAFQHALAAGDSERAVHLVEEHAGSRIWRGELATVLEWLNALPDEVVRSRPRLCVDRAWALFMSGQVSAVEPCLRDAERGLVQRASSRRMAGDEREIAPLLDEVALLRLFTHYDREDFARAIELSQQALEGTDEDDLAARGFLHLNLGGAFRRGRDMARAAQAYVKAAHLCRAAGNTLVAMVSVFGLVKLYEIQGQLHLAAETCRQALESAGLFAPAGSQSGNWQHLPALGIVRVGMADVLYEWNELEAAEQHVQQGIALGGPGGYLGLLVNGYTTLARIMQARGNEQDALHAIHEAEQAVQKRGLPQPFADMVAVYRARLCVAQGNLEAAARWARTVELCPDDELTTLREFKWITLARVLLAQGRLDEAGPLLERLLQAAESDGRMGRAIELLALQALLRQASGDAVGALATLRRALALAEPEGYVRTFVDEGKSMAVLLRYALSHGIAPSYAGQLLAAFGESAGVQPLAEPLTAREFEVLCLIVGGLKNQEIADRLVISIATVKRHISNIYAKLGVHRRTQAIARTQELDLLKQCLGER
jgi:LuxR family maltose regulon positive regulatory protein